MWRPFLPPIALVLFMAGCSLESSALLVTAGDTSLGDTATSETDVPDTGDPPIDSSVTTDSAPLDSSAMDSATPMDSSMPDTTVLPDTTPPTPPTCDDTFGGIRSYVHCDETATECEFYSDPVMDMTCTQLCAVGGETCLGTWSEGPSSDICRRAAPRPEGCADPGDAYLCRCTRPSA